MYYKIATLNFGEEIITVYLQHYLQSDHIKEIRATLYSKIYIKK